jgi:hypothetical protein
MSPLNIKRSSDPSAPEFTSIRIEGFEPSWAGPNPFVSGFCFGSEDGVVALTDESGNVIDEPQLMSSSHEAISGVAGFDRFLAACTRQELAVWALPERTGEKTTVATLQQGAHGVIASSSKQFVAPLGHAGLMMVKPSADQQSVFSVYPFDDGEIDIYQTQELPSAGPRHFFATACRSKGVGLIEYCSEKETLEFESGNFPGLDVIDVATAGNAEYPNAVVAAGIGGEVLLFRDIVNHEAPILLDYKKKFAGKTYRILTARGHIFVLTSKAMYVLGGVASRLTQPTLDERDAPIMTIPMQAIDANICADRWLLAVMHKEVRRYDIRQIDAMIADFAANGNGVASPLPRSTRNDTGWQPAKGSTRRLQAIAS